MSGPAGMECVGIATSTNAAYELMKHSGRMKEREAEYEVVGLSISPVVPLPLPQERENGYVNVPPRPAAVASSQDREGGTQEEIVYESISGDK